MNALYYKTPLNQFDIHYQNVKFPFVKFPFTDKNIQTQLPKNIATIRAVASVVLTGYLAFKLAATVFCWPVVIVGTIFTGWTIYSHLYSKDPLMEAFYKICGGKHKFEQLPEISLGLNSKERNSIVIKNLKWDDLEYPIAKAKTLDGRNIIIIKVLNRNTDERFQGVLAFIERFEPSDCNEVPLPDYATSVAHAIFFPLEGNTFGGTRDSSTCRSTNNAITREFAVYSSISKDMANELFAQLNPPSKEF
jgi:hypothetical protein